MVTLTLVLIAVLAIGVYVVLWLANDRSWPAGFATLAVLILISLAMNAILLGIIGEYLARIYRQVKPGPLTIVERFVDHGATPPDGQRRAPHAVSGIVLPGGASDGGAKDPHDGV